jgi:hypothetical protein
MRDKMNIYEKDKNAYYNANTIARKENDENMKNKLEYSKYANQRYVNSIYKKDSAPYYSPTGEFRIFSNKPSDKLLIPIEIKDLTDQTPSIENLKNLEKTVEDLEKSENINNLSSSNKYVKDPKAYYDPSYQDKLEKKIQIKKAIQKVRSNLIDQKHNFTEENFKIETKIENYKNTNKENTNELIGESYYYDLEKFKSK